MEATSARLKEWAIELGAELVGIADLNRLQELETIPADLLRPFSRAVVIGISVAADVFDRIDDEPTPEYGTQYVVVNQRLDQICGQLEKRLQELGQQALAIPASKTVDEQKWLGQLSTKALARVAGLGWQGKSLLLVTPQFGPRVRVACVLTAAPLHADQPIANRCGSCRRCTEACPAQAIRGGSWPEHPQTVDDALDLNKCVARLEALARKQGRTDRICGVCIKVCPWGRRKE